MFLYHKSKLVLQQQLIKILLILLQKKDSSEAGYKIIQNRTIETDEIGKAQMLLLDGTFAIGPNSSVTLDKFVYNPKTSEGSLEVSAKGLLRLVGGKVTKKSCVN